MILDVTFIHAQVHSTSIFVDLSINLYHVTLHLIHHRVLLVYCSLPGLYKPDVISLGDVGSRSPSFTPKGEAVHETPIEEYGHVHESLSLYGLDFMLCFTNFY